jgi:DNA-binding MarR family transcriptional regulator
MNKFEHVPDRPDTLEETTIETLIMTVHGLMITFDREMMAIGLSARKLYMLDLIYRADHPLTFTELSEMTRSVKSNISQMIDRLEADGLVRRVRGEEDRRLVTVEMTPAGCERYGQGAALYSRLAEGTLSTLKPFEIQQLHDYLSRINAHVDENCAYQPERSPADFLNRAYKD